MQQLKDLLEIAVSHTKFDMGRVEHRSNGSWSSYAERPGEVIESGQFRSLVIANKWNDESISAQGARLVVPGEIHSQLNRLLHDLLDEYIESKTDEVGHALPINGGNSFKSESFESSGLIRLASISKVGDLVYALVRGAVVLGAERVVDLVLGWVQGEPVEYSSSTLIGGLYIDEPLVPLDGVSISPLPRSSSKLPGDLPRIGGLSKRDYIGRTKVTLRTCATPAFLHPDNVRGGNGVRVFSASGLEFSQVCKALSLFNNSHIEPVFFWNDYLELSALGSSSRQGIWSPPESGYSKPLPSGTSYNFDAVMNEETVVLPEESIANPDAREIRDFIEAVIGANSRELNLAIERWSRSKRSAASLGDSFIDLRIALEVLFLKDFTNEYSQEMRFRLALFGAWYLGGDFQERKRIRKTLRDAYDRASGVVHGSDLRFNDSNRELLSDAQELCRRGILKQVRTGVLNSEQWGDLVLGSELERQ